jgi:lysyl-tRNA synthetase class 2
MSDALQIIRNRNILKKLTREFFERRDYVEVDTPILTVCPGTEVHLNYFETSWMDHQKIQHQRFLRSSPELHMKRVVAAGADRVFQLGPCFRNSGEFSEWHHPEFHMLEWYQVGLSYEAMIDETENYLRNTAQEMALLTGVDPSRLLPKSFERIGVFEAFKSFADLDLVDGDPELAAKAIAKGIISVQPEDDFETSYFKVLIEKIEPVIASMHGCVLMDYPPSQAALAVVSDSRACRFEYYLGRVELCNGFFELTGEALNRERIGEALRQRSSLGYSPVPEDEAFYAAMSKFSNPCSGNALGFDRWLALLTGGKSLDRSITFRNV